MSEETISKLEVGMVFKNRRKLCEFLNEKYAKQTNSKKAQDKKWKQYFNFETIEGSQEIQVTEIYEKPQINFATKGGAFPEKLTPAVLKCLTTNKPITNNRIAKALRLTRDEIIYFSKGLQGQYGFAKLMYETRNPENKDMATKDDLEDIINGQEMKIYSQYITKTTQSYKSRISTAMGNLDKFGIIDYYEGYIINHRPNYFKFTSEYVCKDKQKGKINLAKYAIPSDIDMINYCIEECEHFHGKNWDAENLEDVMKNYFSEPYSNPKTASPDDEKLIKKIHKKVAVELGYENEKQLMQKALWNTTITRTYYEKLNDEFNEYGISIYKGYYVYSIRKDKIDFEFYNEENLNHIFCEIMRKRFYDKANADYTNDLAQAKVPSMAEAGLRRKKGKELAMINNFVDKYLKTA